MSASRLRRRRRFENFVLPLPTTFDRRTGLAAMSLDKLKFRQRFLSILCKTSNDIVFRGFPATFFLYFSALMPKLFHFPPNEIFLQFYFSLVYSN